MGAAIQSLCKETRYKILCLSLAHNVCYQVTTGNQAGLRKPSLDKPLPRVTFQELTGSWSKQSFPNKEKFILLVYSFQDPSFPLNPFFFFFLKINVTSPLS